MIGDSLNRKTSMDDYNYYRKELTFKLDRSEIESFKQEFAERIMAFDMKINEKSSIILNVKEFVEKMETNWSQ